MQKTPTRTDVFFLVGVKLFDLVERTGFEPVTSELKAPCSTVELAFHSKTLLSKFCSTVELHSELSP
jgi:hypothetical protein